MVSELRRQIDKLDGQTELYLVLCLLALALLMILVLVACNCAMSCCQCRKSRKKERRYRDDDEKYNDDYYQQIHSLLQRQQTVEREWEEKRRIRDEYRLLTPEQAAESLSRLASRSSSPARIKRNRPSKSSLKTDTDLKDELANYKINHTVRIRTPEDEISPTLKRKSWSAILDGKEIQLNEEELSGGSMVIVRRYEPIKIMRSPSFKKDKQQASRQFVGSDKKKRSQRPSMETIV